MRKNISIHRISGYSLVELMVTMLIGLIILNGVFKVIFTSKQSQKDHAEISYIQENARFAIDVLGRDIRMAGYVGCGNKGTEQVNVIQKDALSFMGDAGISGFDGDSNSSAFPEALKELVRTKTDAIYLRHGVADQEVIVREQNPATKKITLWKNHSFDVGQPMAIVDGSCNYSALFVASDIPTSNSLSHKVGTQNCSSILKGRYDCHECSGTFCPRALEAASYPSGSRLMPLSSSAYFIGESALTPGAPALKRQSLVSENGELTFKVDELASGIENIQFVYGVDINQSGRVSEYRKASEMDLNDDGIIDKKDWKKVISVKVDMLLISQSQTFSDDQSIVFNGVTYKGRFFRQVVSTTIQVRNEST